jgi:sigma-70-like protein
MASFQDLPDDQRAVLELVLRRGRTYDEIAQLLSIDRAGVRQRALAALDALGPQSRVASERRALITDYLLGALPEAVASDVRSHLAQSASERAWARAVSSELQEVAGHPLPEVPAEQASVGRASAGEASAPQASAGPAPAGEASAGHEAEADKAGPPARPSSRRGGALLLAAAAAVIVAVVLILVLPGGSHNHTARQTAAAGVTAATGATGATGSTGARVVAAIALKPPSGGKSPLGFAEVLQLQGRFGVAIAAEGLAANRKHPPDAYAVWLSNSPGDSQIVGFVSPAVSANGMLRTAGALPANASHFKKLLVTLETSASPKTPGKIVLAGAFRL